MPSPKSKPKPAPEPIVRRFEAIGTAWTIELYQPLPMVTERRLFADIAKRIARFDRVYSRFRPDSMVSKIARRAGRYRLPADAEPLIETYKLLYKLSDGAVTPLIGQVLSDAGYDADYSLRPGQLRQPSRWEDAIDFRPPLLVTKQPVLLDFGAAGKGYLIDLVAELITAAGVTSFCIDAGGDVVARGRLQRIGLEHPDHPNQIVGVAELSAGSLCGSAGNRRIWAGFHHIINPHSLASPQHIKALWVTAATGLIADGLTTALYFVSPIALQKAYNFEYAIVFADNSLERSPGFPGEFFTGRSR